VRREDAKGHRNFNLQLDLPALEKKIDELGDVLLVEIDPITSYLGHVDSHKNAELRSVLEPLGEMAARLGVTIIGNTHLSKMTAGSANSRVIGSVAFVNHARAAFIVTRNPQDKDRRVLISSKTNLGRPQEALGYRITTTTILDADEKLLWAPYDKWEESTVAITADEAVAAMAGDTEARGARDQAKNFLLELLVDGPVPQKEIKAASEGAGLAWRTVQRAKASLGIEARRKNDKWFWRLPKSANQESKIATLRNGALGTLGALKPSENGKDAKDAKDAKFLSGHLEERDGALGDTYPELPAFLDRRARTDGRSSSC
jgi:putative DNA primase/helicase